jgi:predicted transcriptional regulator
VFFSLLEIKRLKKLMDFDSFLSSQRWEILQILAQRPASPVEIAEMLKTTVSYVSQQLKLLDAAGIVSKKKTGASERGKPRSLFSISTELAYLSILTNGFSEKKSIPITPDKLAIIKIWISCPESLHESAQKFYFRIKDEVENYGIYYNKGTQRFFAVLENKKAGERFISELKKINLNFDVISENQLSKHKGPEFVEIISNLTLMKGGEMNKNE